MDRLKNFGKRMAKNTAKRLVKAAGKKILAALMPILVSLWPLWLGLIAITIILAATYSVMPQYGFLTEAHQSKQDADIQQYADSVTQNYNLADIHIVSGEGRWYPGGGEQVSQFMDRSGKDAQLANKWGDIYAPVLYKTMMNNTDVSERFPMEELDKVAKDLHPYFYLKESTVTVCDEDGCESYTVYLLVEAYTIRGHFLYEYEWVTDVSSSGSATYEVLKNTITVGSKWDRLDAFMQDYYKVPSGQETENARDLVFNAGEGFSAGKEWLKWLNRAFGGSYAWASGTMIPPELRAYFDEASQMYGIPPWFLAAVAMRESSFNPLIPNPDTGCYGLMQVSPSNWQHYAPQLGFDVNADRDNPRAQIMMGTFLLYEQGMKDVNWSSSDWQEQTLPVLMFYGGFRGPDAEQRCRKGYAKDIWGYAEQFKGTANTGWPVDGSVTSYFGGRIHPVTGKYRMHNGIDIAASMGTAIVSVSGGVAYTGCDNVSGYFVCVKDAKYEYIYCHMSSQAVGNGQAVTPGQVIGYVGSTGSSTGPHLHFGVKDLSTGQYIDPLTILGDKQ